MSSPRKPTPLALVLGAILLASCAPEPSAPPADDPGTTVEEGAVVEAAQEVAQEVGAAEDGGGAVEAGPGGAAMEPADDASVAASIVRDYYAAIAAGDYERAWKLWRGEGERSGQTLEELRNGFAETATVEAEVSEPARIEGAAGSRYAEVPVTVHATKTDGSAQCFEGHYVLRRAVVPGATAEQRAWRIESADLAACASS